MLQKINSNGLMSSSAAPAAPAGARKLDKLHMFAFITT